MPKSTTLLHYTCNIKKTGNCVAKKNVKMWYSVRFGNRHKVSGKNFVDLTVWGHFGKFGNSSHTLVKFVIV